MISTSQNRVLPAEWYPQSAVQLTWPHANTDWAYMLDEVEACFVNIAKEILKRQILLVVCADKAHVGALLDHHPRLRAYELDSNDTWARDHGGITVLENGEPVLLDFKFNGWGLKFAADKDNRITNWMLGTGVFKPRLPYQNCLNVVLEGGSIESDGKGSIMTTSQCLMSPNRNGQWNFKDVKNYLAEELGCKRILWLHNGYLSGDDTDSHVDTLARFCDEETIAYVQCTDEKDEHYKELKLMETDLKRFTTFDDKPYRLVPLPMTPAIYDKDDGHRLPATYANFLIINGAVLFPIYNCATDDAAVEVIKGAMPNHEIVPIDCSALIRQHGSLHCVTMQYPAGVVLV
jgi:agmatine deiminase